MGLLLVLTAIIGFSRLSPIQKDSRSIIQNMMKDHFLNGTGFKLTGFVYRMIGYIILNRSFQ